MEREPVRKTYKLFVGGAFVRSESGYVLRQDDASGAFVANCSKASRKDLRDAIGAARKAFGGWSSRSAFNRWARVQSGTASSRSRAPSSSS